MSNCGLYKGATTMHGSCHLNQLHDCKNLMRLELATHTGAADNTSAKRAGSSGKYRVEGES